MFPKFGLIFRPLVKVNYNKGRNLEVEVVCIELIYKIKNKKMEWLVNGVFKVLLELI